jgi:hypothetical protein
MIVWPLDCVFLKVTICFGMFSGSKAPSCAVIGS